MIFGDSCHFIALVQTSDALHLRAVRWAKTLKEPILVTEYVLWEVVNGLSDPADRRLAHAAANHILTTRGYVLRAGVFRITDGRATTARGAAGQGVVTHRLHLIQHHDRPRHSPGVDP